jgi:hypothetical protein
VLSRDPVCQECQDAMSTVADHLMPWKDQPDPTGYALDPDNCRGVCKPCHDRKSGGEAHRRPSPAGDAQARGGSNLEGRGAANRRVSQARVPSKFEGGGIP